MWVGTFPALAVIALFIAIGLGGPAVAQELSGYVGKWGVVENDCPPKDEEYAFLLIEASGAYDLFGEKRCQIVQAQKSSNSRLRVTLKCEPDDSGPQKKWIDKQEWQLESAPSGIILKTLTDGEVVGEYKRCH